MLPVLMMSPEELAQGVAERARALRLSRNLSQAGLAASAGISLASLKRFEHKGEIAFVSLIRLAFVLDATKELESWFSPPPFRTLDEALQQAIPRRRGRKK